MELRLTLLPGKIYSNKPENIKEYDKGNALTLSPTYTHGKKSKQILLAVTSGSDPESYFSVDLNKNEALYLANHLMSFVKEKDIDINDED